MTAKRLIGLLFGVAVLATLSAGSSSQGMGTAAEISAINAMLPSRVQQPIIIDHTCTDLNQIPQYWVERAREELRVAYGHTSHGSQPITGMIVLRDDPSYGGLYGFSTNGAVTSGTLSVADGTPEGDLGNPDRVTWEARTRAYLAGVGSDRNVMIWSWCGQVSGATKGDIDTYLSLMNGLEQDYPDVTFVYMTGHLDGSGVDGNLHQRNNQIREYCKENNKALFDFADIESYDPEGGYYVDLAANDGCYYDGDGNGSLESNWALEWCASQPGNPLCASCDCAHSQSLNCNLKARAFWWMMARLAGWEGQPSTEPDLTPSSKKTSSPFSDFGGRITYTVAIRSASGPLTSTVLLTDTVPDGLAFVPGTLSATSGHVDDAMAPKLYWSGVLTPTPAVTVTYAATVTYPMSGTATAVLPRVITNTALIQIPDYTVITRTATVRTDWLRVFLPMSVRDSD